jgi:serine protease Do
MKTFRAAFAILLISFSASAESSLWTEGKDKPSDRVNTGLRALSPDAYIRVAEKVDEAVVNVSTTQVIKSPHRGFLFSPFGHPRTKPRQQQDDNERPDDPFGDFFDRFFGQPPSMPKEDLRQQSLGSGFVLNPEGYIVTNNHVVEKADEIKVILSNETELKAKVVGRDPKTDVALLKVDSPKPLKSVVLGDSDQMKVGEVVVAIGNPFGLSHTVTQGIVSAKERTIGVGPYDEFIQTDASINPGNSGGPLLNLQGEVIGINTAIIASGQGIGFAIPINLAKDVLTKLKRDGKVVRGWLGVLIQKVTPEHATALKLSGVTGALVSDVVKNSPALKAGIKVGDVIVKFRGKEIKDWHELPIAVAGVRAGEKVPIEFIRDGERKTVEVEIAKLEDKEGEPASAENTEADRLGLRVQELTNEMAKSLGLDEDVKGVVVAEVDPAGAAAEKGVRRGDVIIEMNRKKIANRAAYLATVSALRKGDSVLLLVKRGEGTIFIAFTY